VNTRFLRTTIVVWAGIVTKDDITMREAVFPDRVTPPSTTDAYKKAPRSGVAKMSEYIMDGVWDGFTPPPLPEA
jgi:ribonuclease Z